MKGLSTSKYSSFVILVSLSCVIGFITYGSSPGVSILSRISQEYRNIRYSAAIAMFLTGKPLTPDNNSQSDFTTGKLKNSSELDTSGIRQATATATEENIVKIQNSTAQSGKIEISTKKTKTTTLLFNEVFMKGNNRTEHNMKKAQSRSWQPCGNGSDVFVYSAYYRPEEHDVRVVGIALREVNRTVFCTFPRESELQEVTATVQVLPDHQGLKSSAVIMGCSLGHSKIHKPDVVGIKVDNNVAYLRVISPKPRQFNFTVCVACLHGPYTDYAKVIEMVETDLIFGADHFLMYRHSTTPQVEQVLQHYVKKGLLEVLEWRSPPVRVHYYAQMAQVQDCILSSRGISKYLAIKDLDELIVPHKHKTWHELMNFLDLVNGKNATFIFRNTFFEFSWKDVIQPKPGSPRINSLKYVWRDKRFYENKVRSKAIMRPERVEIGGIHFTWKEKKGFISHGVDTAVAYVHHYRAHDRYKWKVKDTRMLDFMHILKQKVNETYVQLAFKP